MTEPINEKGLPGPSDNLARRKDEGTQRASFSSRDSNLRQDIPPLGASEEEKGLESRDSSDATRTSEEIDQFEVDWDGGDDDPLCPRSMSLPRKWMMVFITCIGSLCVWVPSLT